MATPQIGEEQFIAEWLIEDGGNDIEGCIPELCKYGEKSFKTLRSALKHANKLDLNHEGNVFLERFNGVGWVTYAKYSNDGGLVWERLDE